MADTLIQNETDESFSSLKEQFEDQRKELELPSYVDKNKVEDLRERRNKTIEEVNRMMKGIPKGQDTKKIIFSMYIPEKEPDRKIGDKWVDKDGKEWERTEFGVTAIPKIDRAELIREGYLMPDWCPRCKNPMKHWLDRKMWPIHNMCFNCVTEMETDLRAKGQYQEYERQKVMANVRSFYNDVMDSRDDIVKTFRGSYVNSFGDVEKWDNVKESELYATIDSDLKNLADEFEKTFGESLIVENNNVI
jgi:hypothetical protein